MRHGFIRESREIKYLILYCLSFMPFSVGESDILDMVLIDDAFGYFEFSESFNQLLETRHVAVVDTVKEKEYLLTAKGHDIVRDMSGDLPLSVRDKAEKAALRVVMKIRRESTLRVNHRENEDGTFTVQLKICDKNTEHLGLDLMVVSARQCAIIEDNFKKNAEGIYRQLLLLLSGAQI